MRRWIHLTSAAFLFVLACSSSEGATSSDDDEKTPASTDAGTKPTPCPADLGVHWKCDGGKRVRCVDALLVEETCASGCAAGEDDEAVCSCGSQTGFSRWNCVDSGRASCAGGKSWITASCGTNACVANENGVSDKCASSGPLASAVVDIGTSCSNYAPGVRCSIAVVDLVTNARGEYKGQDAFVSASAAKTFWVAAALFDTSVADVQPHEEAIFTQSDNIASGQVIDLLSSPERVNTFLWQDAEVVDIGFCHWNYGGTREAKNCPSVLGDDNFLTTSDTVSFLTKLWDHSLLGAEKSKTLLSWMTQSPRQGYGGWLGTQLPAAARTTMHHKAGWLPPKDVPGYSNANDIGIVEIASGHAYAVAIALDGASSQADYDDRELPLLEYLSCAVYHAVAGDDASSCKHP